MLLKKWEFTLLSHLQSAGGCGPWTVALARGGSGPVLHSTVWRNLEHPAWGCGFLKKAECLKAVCGMT